MANIIDSSNVGNLLQGIFAKIKAAFWQRSEITEIPVDQTPTTNSNNLVTSGGVKNLIDDAVDSIPVISTDISNDANSDTKTASPKAVKTYVDTHITNISAISVPDPADGTLIVALANGDTITVDLNHDHTQYPKYILCADESAYNAIQTKDNTTLYLIPVTS